jgi:CRISPR-associated endonuclease Cas1
MAPEHWRFQMHHHPNPRRRVSRPLVHVATGYAISVRVFRGRLVIEDGVGRERRRCEYGRTDRLSRLIVHGSTGSITLDAIRWLTAIGAMLIHVDHAGELQATAASLGSDNPALRRAQALAATSAIGIRISRDILSAKLAGQASVAASLDADVATTIDDQRARLGDCRTLEDLRLVEAQAAAAHWAAWRGVQAEFVTRDAERVPVHWTSFTQRASVLTGSPRVAVDLICAILNYLYAILEAESRIALLAVGLDPGIGILHTDQRARDSLALDLMEAVRPAVDRYVLDLLARRLFSLKDVHEATTGQCRLLSRFARELAHTSPTWAAHLGPHAEMIARELAADAQIPRLPTVLTGAARRQARPTSDRTRAPTMAKPIIRAACVDCGTTIPRDQKRCADCHATANADRLRTQQSVEVIRRHSAGTHPSRDPAVRDRISQAQRAQWIARKATESVSGFTGQPSEFRRLILPKLAGIQPAALARATGLSPGYCAEIRDGKRVPHPRHWVALQLAGLESQPTPSESAP